MDNVWKYLPSKEIKHLFYASRRQTSVCGVTIQWFSNESWKSDKEGLAECRPCKRCTRYVK